ncbi:MAG TPA: hypothetical protein DCM14_02715 [Clostridiales bacterium UBA8153]|nr:hypothetical protein [Clostridiales bacterium UBA8153]
MTMVTANAGGVAASAIACRPSGPGFNQEIPAAQAKLAQGSDARPEKEVGPEGRPPRLLPQ